MPDGVDAHSFGATAQSEVALRLASGPFYFRFDYDVYAGAPALDPTWRTPSWSVTHNSIKLGPPEWAMLQIGREYYHLRLGILTHPIGFEDWDNWNNYFPTYSTMFATVPGRMAGIEPGFVLENGVEMNVHAGFDFDFYAPTFGGGVTTAQDTFATWSGVAFYPTLRFYEAVLATEFTPADFLSIDVDGSVGLIGKEDGKLRKHLPFIGGEVVVNVLPAEVVQPTFRVQGLIEPENVLSDFLGDRRARVSASAGLTAHASDEFRITVEGKVSKIGDETVPAIFTMVAFRRKEPPPYAAAEEKKEDASDQTPAARHRRAAFMGTQGMHGPWSAWR